MRFLLFVSLTSIIILFSSGLFAHKKSHAVQQKARISYEKDGSIKYILPDGTTKNVSMDGKTPYGLDIKQESRTIKRKNFLVEIVYSNALSDDIMDKNMKRFYEALIKEAHKKMYMIEVPAKRMKIIVSNCRFCKTGYCKRNNQRGVKIISYLNNKKIKDITFDYYDVTHKKKYSPLAAKAISELFKKV